MNLQFLKIISSLIFLMVSSGALGQASMNGSIPDIDFEIFEADSSAFFELASLEADAQVKQAKLNEVSASFPGGVTVLMRYLIKSLSRESISKTTKPYQVEFEILETGQVSSIRMVPDSLAKFPEILKVFNEMGPWRPATRNGHPVTQVFRTSVISGFEIYGRDVDQLAEPPGGMMDFYNGVGEVIRYPIQAREKKIQGRVFVSFVVEKDGHLTDIHSVKDIGYGCGEEAVRAVRQSPDWNPAVHKGRAVRQGWTLPIIFKIH